MSLPVRPASAVLLVSALALTGCAGGSDSGGDDSSEAASFGASPSGTLSAWAFDNADDVGKARLAYAQSQVGGVTVKLDQTSFDSQKFTTRAASGDLPDVVQMDRALVGTYAAQGLIKPLDQCYAAHHVDASTLFYPAVADSVKYRDQLWAVPQFYQPAAIITNTRVLDEAGVKAEQIDTSKPDDLVAAAKTMYKASGGAPTRLGFDPVATGQPELWMLASGGKLMDDSGKPTLDDAKNVTAIETLKKISDAQGGHAKIKSFSDAFDTFGKNNQYVKDQVGAQANAQWYLNVLSPYVAQEKISAVAFKDTEGKPITYAGGSAFVIPASAKNPDAACAWALSLVSQPAWDAAAKARSETLAKTPGAINTGLFTGSPAADTAIRQKYVKATGNAGFDAAISTFYDIVDDGKSIGVSPAGEAIKNELKNAITAALLGQKEPQQALADAQAAAMRSYNQTADQ
ncbi:sugar ABC transporter substrate-binding protein [Tersicoccus solisilvae]|uniref:Sugar ABC transporter substrate-binding protein n=1 Tax=Tersicoccus solisilvae TaxID=1882339 RepID=A0ABQ1NTZ0_9MICC|nr:sugar ABC transporter substrate-binding protein [Tersicoccus solisilvae]GGC83949.1 sugar ABC transporter substrate-binding protein [Tersicoccus solisilvae]